MTVGVRATVTDSGILAALSVLVLLPADTAPMYEELGIGFVENSRLRFVDQVAPDDTPWIPSQRAIKQNGQTLRDTGRLMNSMTHVVHPDGVEYGTDTPYAGYLHDGTSRMPARPIVGFSADDEEFALNVITAFIQRSLGGKS